MLGIKVDCKLKYNQHIELVVSSAKNAANLLLQLNTLNIKSTTDLYKIFCRTRLEHGVLLWGHNINRYGNWSKIGTEIWTTRHPKCHTINLHRIHASRARHSTN